MGAGGGGERQPKFNPSCSEPEEQRRQFELVFSEEKNRRKWGSKKPAPLSSPPPAVLAPPTYRFVRTVAPQRQNRQRALAASRFVPLEPNISVLPPEGAGVSSQSAWRRRIGRDG